jgi:pimeloyl-ACP methyl ester carboxylesterase
LLCDRDYTVSLSTSVLIHPHGEHNALHVINLDRGAVDPTLLLLRGQLCDYRFWGVQMQPLPATYRVVAPSLRLYWPGHRDGEQQHLHHASQSVSHSPCLVFSTLLHLIRIVLRANMRKP